MFSFKQLYNIVNIVTDNSSINDRLKKAEGNVADIYNKLNEQTQAREDLKKYTDDHFNKNLIKMDNMTHAQDLVNNDKQKQLDDHQKMLSTHKDTLKKLNKYIEELKAFDEVIALQMEKAG